MLRFSALVPDATVNYVKNPSMRYDTTDWNADGSTLTRSLEQARFGVASLKVVTTGTALRQGAYYRVSALRGVAEPITVSAYVRGTGRGRIRLINNPAGSEWASDSVQLEMDRWNRLSVSGFSTGSDDLRLYVETQEVTATARTFYVDGAQLERKSYPTTYCDGDQPGCRWNGLYHASTSQRNAYSRAGGRWVQLAGEERQAQDLYMTVVNGLGVAPLINNVQPFALAPGSYFQNTKINARPITLTFHAKHRVEDRDEPVSLAALHQLRQLLIDVIKPDRTGGSEEIWFEYDDGNTPLYFQARYEGGLTGEWDIRNQFVNSFPLNLMAVSPLLREDSQEVATIDFQETITTNFVAGRIDGVWRNLNFGFNDSPKKIRLGDQGEVYAVGDNDLTVVNNNAAAVDPLRAVRGVTYWDGEKWNLIGNTTALGGGGTPTINDIAVAPNGDVYVCGSFTSIGGVAANRIAKWNGSAWSALGTGLNGGTALCLAFAPNGDLYVGGDSFTTAGGISAVRIARWDGSSWHQLGQYRGLNSTVFSIAVSNDGLRLYAGGLFTDENGNPGSGLTRVASYNTVTGLFSAMASGLNNTVNVLKISPASGDLYAGGTFSASGSDTMRSVATWNGSTWVGLGSGLLSSGNAGICQDLDFFKDGNLLAVGSFDTAGETVTRNMAIWNGSTWVTIDADINVAPTGTNYIVTCLIDPLTDDLYMGWTATGTFQMRCSGITTLTNSGTAEVSPTLYVLGPGTLKWVENQTTKKRIFMNLQILQNEEVFFDLARGEVFSTVRGSLLFGLYPSSDIKSFTLVPGENKLACFMLNDVNAQMQIGFTPLHWSADATQHGESL